jgi:hypothetical protein
MSALPPESGHVRCNLGCPLWANGGHAEKGSSFTATQEKERCFKLRSYSKLYRPTGCRVSGPFNPDPVNSCISGSLSGTALHKYDFES